ncbi:MAG: histidine phosphatase family protein [Dongiaceae bacterium]
MSLALSLFHAARHPECVANAEKRMADGLLDAPLTEKGLEQAQNLAQLVAHLPCPSMIVHTGMIRTEQTANVIRQVAPVPVIAVPQLKEQIAGDWSGKPLDEVLPLAMKDIDPPNGEKWRPDFVERINEGMSEVASRTKPREAPPFLIVHGRVLDAMLELCGFDKLKTKVDNGAVLRFILRGKEWIIDTPNLRDRSIRYTLVNTLALQR